MKKISILLGMLFMLFNAHSQKHILIRFSSQENIPKATYSDVSKSYSLSCADNQLENIFKLFSISKFQKAYPHAHLVDHKYAPKLDRVYRLETTNDIHGLYQNLKNIKSDLLEGTINLLEEPKLLALPDDYNLICSPFYCNTYCYSLQNDLINASGAWDITTGNPNIRIAITDLNFRRSHEELSGKALLDSASSFDINQFDHGTGVAVMAAGNTNNGVGLASIGYNCKLDFYNYADYDIMLRAAINGARVINCSWYTSCNYYDSTQQMIIDMIHDTYKTVIVAGAGNGNSTCGIIANHYPASYNHVISVTAVGHIVDLSAVNSCFAYSFKDVFYGRLDDTAIAHFTSNANVDLCAPAWGVIRATNSGDQAYGSAFGTSFASPAVAGTAALILSVNPNLTPDDVQAILKCTARDLYEIPVNIGQLNKLGSGRIDAGKAVQLAQTWVANSAPAQQAPPTDIRWFEILSNGVNTIEVESTCAANSNPGYCNIGYRLEVVAPNPSQTFKWLTFYLENNNFLASNIPTNIKYGNSIYLSRGVDYPFTNSSIGSIKACVRVNECIPSIYYTEDRASACLGVGCTYNCPADITISGNYATTLTESYTWVKSAGQTNISSTTSVKLDGSPTQGYVEFKPTTGADYLLAEPTATGEFIVQAYNGCDAGAPSFAGKKANQVNDEVIKAEMIAVYPNPTNGLFYIDCNNKVSSIQIYNSQGMVVLEKIINNNKKATQKLAIDLSNFAAGVYFLRSKGENFNYKIVKL